MKAKNLLPFLLLLVLISIAAYFYFSKKNTTLKNDEFLFQVKDTSQIEKITIYNSADTVFLEKISNGWKVNGLFEANASMLKLCFNVLKNTEVQSVLSDEFSEKAVELLLKSPLVEVQQNHGENIQFYIFPNKMTRQVWAMSKNGRKPIVIQLPAYEGNFAALFFASRNEWREKNVSFNLQEIRTIEVKHYSNDQMSFSLEFSEKKVFLKDYKGQNQKFDIDVMRQYLHTFRNIPVVEFIHNSSSADSLKMQKAFSELIINYNNARKDNFKFFSKGNPADANEAYLLLNNQDMAIVKYIAIDLLIPESDLFKE